MQHGGTFLGCRAWSVGAQLARQSISCDSSMKIASLQNNCRLKYYNKQQGLTSTTTVCTNGGFPGKLPSIIVFVTRALMNGLHQETCGKPMPAASYILPVKMTYPLDVHFNDLTYATEYELEGGH